jgi:hypothetical protein
VPGSEQQRVSVDGEQVYAEKCRSVLECESVLKGVGKGVGPYYVSEMLM